jgi:hypothetical protein
MINSYSLNASDGVISHGYGAINLFNEPGDLDTPEAIDALVASGDCFVTLATALEAINQSLTADAKTAGPQLERLASILFYMQRYYKIKSKTPDHRGGIY